MVSLGIPLFLVLAGPTLEDPTPADPETEAAETAETLAESEAKSSPKATDDGPSRSVRRVQRRCKRLEGKDSHRADRICNRADAYEQADKRLEKENYTFQAVFRAARQARCATALCFGPANKYGFEPLLEMPIGKMVAVNPSSLARFVNGNDVSISFNAGLRFWIAYDWISFNVYFSKPILPGDQTIVIRGSPHEHQVSQVRRPFPGVALGLFADLFWIGFDYDQLRNGSGTGRDPFFARNDVISHAFVFSFAIAPVTGVRSGLGTAVAVAKAKEAKRKEEEAKEEAKEAKRKEEEARKARAEQDRQEQETKDNKEKAEARQREESPPKEAAASGFGAREAMPDGEPASATPGDDR